MMLFLCNQDHLTTPLPPSSKNLHFQKLKFFYLGDVKHTNLIFELKYRAHKHFVLFYPAVVAEW